jgi:aspartate aminotransferase-like enzyme
MLKNLRKRYGAIFAGGQDQLKGKIVRIAHLGHSDELDLVAAIAALEFGLKASGHTFKLGSGVQATMAWLAEN